MHMTYDTHTYMASVKLYHLQIKRKLLAMIKPFPVCRMKFWNCLIR